jgi:hypothetical protein
MQLQQGLSETSPASLVGLSGHAITAMMSYWRGWSAPETAARLMTPSATNAATWLWRMEYQHGTLTNNFGSTSALPRT